MPKTEQNIREAEQFIRDTLEKNFRQQVDQEQLRIAAEKLCESVPVRQPEMA